MPRLPIVPQRARAPVAFPDSPRAQTEAADLGQIIKQRRELEGRQAVREAKRVRDVAEVTYLSDEAAAPEAGGEIERGQRYFEEQAGAVEEHYRGHPLEDQIKLRLEAQRQAWNRNLVAFEAQRRVGEDLARADEIAERWFERVAQDPAQFDEAVARLLGDDAPLKGLGLRPEVQAAWEERNFEGLLSLQMESDPRRLVLDLESGRWKDRLPGERESHWLEDARAAAVLWERKQASGNRQRATGEVLALQQFIAKGEAGVAQIRRAEREGRFSPEEIESLKRAAEQAEAQAQAYELAQGEYAVTLTSGVGFDPENPQHRQAAEDFYLSTFRKAVQGGADEVIRERLADTVTKTGHMTTGLAQDLTAALLSDDPEKRVAAAQLYGRLLEAAPDLVGQALDPEARAHGGVLNRWLDAGLDAAQSLARADLEMRPDEGLRYSDAETIAALEREAGRAFGAGAGGLVARSLLAQLDERYLDLLGQGLSPQAAQAQIQKSLGKGARRLAQFEARFAEAGFVWTTQNGRRVPVATEAQLEKAAEPITMTAIGVGVLLVGAALIWKIETSKDAGADPSDDIDAFLDWAQELPWEAKVQFVSYLPEAAPYLGVSEVKIPGQGEFLGEIIGEGEEAGTRIVEIYGDDSFYKMSVLQGWDPEREAFVDETGLTLDRQGRLILFDLQTGRVISKEEESRYRSPPFTPPEGVTITPGGFGEGVDPQQPLTTGGAQPDNQPMTDQPEGLVHPEQPVDLITGVPDQSDIAGGPLVALSKKHEAMGQTGYEVDPSTWYPDWPELKDLVPMIPKEWRAKHNQNAHKEGRKLKPGVRWRDPSNQGNGVRVDKGDPASSNISQRVDHVRVDCRGTARGPDGEPIDGKVEDNPQSHIPLTEYLKWKDWCTP